MRGGKVQLAQSTWKHLGLRPSPLLAGGSARLFAALGSGVAFLASRRSWLTLKFFVQAGAPFIFFSKGKLTRIKSIFERGATPRRA